MFELSPSQRFSLKNEFSVFWKKNKNVIKNVPNTDFGGKHGGPPLSDLRKSTIGMGEIGFVVFGRSNIKNEI